MKRASIRQTEWNEVTLEYSEEDGGGEEKRHRRVFWVPMTSSGVGYVREGQHHSGNDSQVCDALYGTGNTLRSSPDGLLGLIRHEWRRRQRIERAEIERYT